MNDNETISVIQKLACGYDPNTGKEIGQNGIQLDQNIQLALSRALAALRRKSPIKVSDLNDEEMKLYDELRKYRSRKAHELGLPAFRIAPDATLAEIARVKPRSIKVLDKIYGLRQKRIDDFGEDFISIVTMHLKSKGSAPQG